MRLSSHRLRRILFAAFAIEVGAFLVVFPWSDYWSINNLQFMLQRWFPSFSDTWNEPSFQGAVTGLGLVNIYIGCAQVINALRRPDDDYRH